MTTLKVGREEKILFCFHYPSSPVISHKTHTNVELRKVSTESEKHLHLTANNLLYLSTFLHFYFAL